MMLFDLWDVARLRGVVYPRDGGGRGGEDDIEVAIDRLLVPGQTAHPAAPSRWHVPTPRSRLSLNYCWWSISSQ